MGIIAKVPIKWINICGSTVLAPDLDGIEGAAQASYVGKNDTHMIVTVDGNIGTVTVPTYNSESEGLADL